MAVTHNYSIVRTDAIRNVLVIYILYIEYNYCNAVQLNEW